MKIATSYTEWTPINETIQCRIWDGKLWRKEFSPYFYGGYQIKYCQMNSRIGQEWLRQYGHFDVTATCSPEVANMIDPNGDLRRAGLLSLAA